MHIHPLQRSVARASAVLVTALVALGAALTPIGPASAAPITDADADAAQSHAQSAEQPQSAEQAQSGDTAQSAEQPQSADQAHAEAAAAEPRAMLTPTITVNDDVVHAAGETQTWSVSTDTPLMTAPNQVLYGYTLRVLFNSHMLFPFGKGQWDDGNVTVDVKTKTDSTWQRARVGGWGEISTSGNGNPQVAIGGTWRWPGPYTWNDYPNTRWAEVATRIQAIEGPGDSTPWSARLVQDITAVRLNINFRMNATNWLLGDAANPDGQRPPSPPAQLANTVHVYADVEAVYGPNLASRQYPKATGSTNMKWGEITAKRTDVAGRTLNGSEFSIFRSHEDAQAFVNAKGDAEAGTALQKAYDFPCTDQEYGDQRCRSRATGADGIAKLPHMRFSGFWKEAAHPASDPLYRKYFVVETKAAPGHELSTEIKEVDLAGDVALTFADASPSNGGFMLPLAGTEGSWADWAPLAFGLAIAAIAGVGLHREWRRSP